MSAKPVAHCNLPASAFPFVVEFLCADTEDVLHRMEVAGPGPLVIPGREFFGVPVAVRILYADGTMEIMPPGTVTTEYRR